MSQQFPDLPHSQGEASTIRTSSSERRPGPWVSRVVVMLCLVNFLLMSMDDLPVGLATAVKRFNPDLFETWSGAYWGLITNNLAHVNWLHLLLNVYWLVELGNRVEWQMGSLRYLLFLLGAGVVSSGLEVAAGESSVGASGLVYALFGYMWLTRKLFPSFQEILTRTNIKLFLAWLVVGVFLSHAELISIANLAHYSGMLFGICVAYAWILPGSQFAAKVALWTLLAASTVPVVWSPWNIHWLMMKGYQAQISGRCQSARGYYDRVLKRDPNDAWTLYNRADVLRELGFPAESERDRKRALELDPSYQALE